MEPQSRYFYIVVILSIIGAVLLGYALFYAIGGSGTRRVPDYSQRMPVRTEAWPKVNESP